MGVTERKARQKEELRQVILDAARQLFVEQGYQAVSMRKIAERIEYSPTTLYLYFRDKDEIFDCICAETFERLLGLIDESGAATCTANDLKQGLRAYIDFALANPQHYRITFLAEDKDWHNPEKPNRRREVGFRAFDCLRRAVACAKESGAIKISDVDATSQMLWASAHGLASLLITCEGFPWVDRETLIDHQLETLLKGLEAI